MEKCGFVGLCVCVLESLDRPTLFLSGFEMIQIDPMPDPHLFKTADPLIHSDILRISVIKMSESSHSRKKFNADGLENFSWCSSSI